jgi:UDP-4-amino-4,6-dideoxy-N-acetyl-beta-L-altrosamine transaminase
MKNLIPYSRQYIDSKDIKAVTNVLKSDFLTSGPEVNKFQNKINKFCKNKYSVAVNSATSALHIACKAIGLKKNDYVWTSSISFVASANCAFYCGGKIDFVDIDEDTFNISISKLKKKLVAAKKKNKLPKILIPVHLGGLSSNMKEIFDLSKKYNFKIIEDASHAVGGKYKGTVIGSCKFSNITIFSFHPVKSMTTGEGGMALTNDKKIYLKMKLLREHGIERNSNNFKNNNNSLWYYEQQTLGFNYRMSDIHAALGLSQLDKVNKFIKKRNLISKKYKKELNKLPIEFQKEKKGFLSTKHLEIILVPSIIHKKLFYFLRKKKIFVNLHYIPLYRHPYYKMKINLKSFLNSEMYYSRALSIPCYYGFTNSEQNYVIKTIKNFFKKNL